MRPFQRSASRDAEPRANELVVALAGNPNVGKSTVFNNLTNLRQHTGNWPGKTVGSAWGRCEFDGQSYLLVDTPGAYSLIAHSAEEEAARDAILFGGADAVAVICDATCLERNLNLVLQVLEVTDRVVVCVNLLDEARKHRIEVDLAALEEALGVPVVGCTARSGKGTRELLRRAKEAAEGRTAHVPTRYPDDIERAAEPLKRALVALGIEVNARFAALRLLEGDHSMASRLAGVLGFPVGELPAIRELLPPTDGERVREEIVNAIYRRAEEIARRCVRAAGDDSRQTRWDRLLTSRLTGVPVMLALLAIVFYVTIVGANAPSAALGDLFGRAEQWLTGALAAVGASAWLNGLLSEGVFRVFGWVISVMLPPMAIFFPLFTLLEDLGYLPRVAFNLDRQFKRCHACGKQCLTMCLGFGCNAAGVVGCRIIDSPRERLIAILTNCFVPCNGRFPMLIALIAIFLAEVGLVSGGAMLSAALLSLLIVLGILMTFAVSRLLSATLLRGVPSSFTLELPPFRRPQIGQVIVRSVFDRTLYVLGRAAAVAAPAGALIWLLANVSTPGGTLLGQLVRALDPFAQALGLDGAILTAFVLGFPANEIVLPLAIMAYLSTGSLAEMGSFSSLRALLLNNGWTWLTALNTMLFSLMHWPCSTTVLTIARETRSAKWTLFSIAVPTACGMAVCAFTAALARLLGLA